MFASFANFQPFQNTQGANKSAANNAAPMTSSLSLPSDQPQNTGGSLSSSLSNYMQNQAGKGAADLMGGSSADARNQLMQGLAKSGNPIAQGYMQQSSIAPTGGAMAQADPSGADGSQGWFDSLLNTFASNSPSKVGGGASSIAQAGSDVAGGDAAAEGGSAAGDAATSGGGNSSFFDWL